MCHVQSLENDFYLGALRSFDCDFTLLAFRVAILGFHNHIEMFFERFFIICHHLVLKENHPQSFHSIMWKKKNCNFKIKNSTTSFHFSQFHNLTMYLFFIKNLTTPISWSKCFNQMCCPLQSKVKCPIPIFKFCIHHMMRWSWEEPTKDLKE